MGRMTLVGLAKNEEEIFFAGDQESLKLPYDSESLKLIRRIRDEVHRFGISFHRKKRSRGTFKNELENIKGIGKKTADQLLKTFHSVKKSKGRIRGRIDQPGGCIQSKINLGTFSEQEERNAGGTRF